MPTVRFDQGNLCTPELFRPFYSFRLVLLQFTSLVQQAVKQRRLGDGIDTTR